MDNLENAKGPVTESDIVPVLPVESRKKVLATTITRLVMGARVLNPWHGRDDIFVIEDVYGSTRLSIFDFNIAKEVAEKIAKELGLQRMVPAHQILVIRDRAQDIMDAFEDERSGKCGIVMLKDGGGCGYWRMSLPSKHMDRTGIYVDVTGGAVDFDHLLEYDTIFLQRVHNWESVVVLERLRAGGKRIIYDIDDDLFNIPASNPAAKAYGQNEMMAAVECMKLSDLVTVSTKALQERIGKIVGDTKVVVVPNAIDPDDKWAPLDQTGSPDEWKRIFWQGSNTHDEDWGECFEAVRHVMKTRDNVRLVLMGFLPSMVQKGLETEDFWKDRVEHLGPMAPEAYFRIIKHIRGDVGLAPLLKTHFNEAKCVDAGTRLSTRCGFIMAGDVKEGMQVWRNGWRNVEAVERTSAVEGVMIETKMGYRLRLTRQHRMSVAGEWKMAGEISVGDEMAMSEEAVGVRSSTRFPWPSDSRMNTKKRLSRWTTSDPNGFLTAPDVPTVEITPRWGRILGAYVGDGSVGQKTTMSISCEGLDQDWIELLIADLRAVGLNPGTEQVKTYSGEVLRRRSVRVASAHLIRFLEGMGLAGKRANGRPIRTPCVPNIVWMSPRAVIAEFLSGYFEADGTLGECCVSATSKTEELIRDIQRLLLAFGIMSRIFPKKHKCQTMTGVYWHIVMNRDATDVFEKEIGFKSSRKRMRLGEITRKTHSNAFQPMSWKDRVVSVTPCEVNPVDLQVEGQEFILTGFISHNSNIKFIENSMIGLPTVASDVRPYAEAITHGVDGFLCKTREDWIESIEMCLDSNRIRKMLVENARSKVRNEFNIKTVAKAWLEVLRGSSDSCESHF